MTFDIESFNSVAACEIGQELELLQPDGLTPVGIFVTVLGAQANQVVQQQNAQTKKVISAMKMAEKQNKETELTERLIDSRATSEILSCVGRVTGWRNVTQPFSVDLMKSALARNPHWIKQINEFSESIGNFTKA
jgi:hypothetical protein